LSAPATFSPQPTGTPRAYTRSNATRLLSAGAYLETPYRKRVVSELVRHWYRVVPPSYGFDAVTVLAHALAARRLRRQQIAGVALGTLALYVLHGVVGGLGSVLLFFWLLWAFAFLRRAATLQALITQLGMSTHGDPVRAEAMAAGGAAADSGHDYPANRALTSELVEKIAHEQAGRQDRIFYGRYVPFVGSGRRLPDWSNLDWSMAEMLIERQPHPLAPYLDRDEEDGADSPEPAPLIPFTVDDITDYVGKHLLADLRDDAPYGEQIEHLTIERRRYSRAGLVPLKRRRWRSSVLLPVAAETESFRLVEDRERYDAAREYLCIRVGAWDQEMVTTVFVGFDLRGNTLYCEFYPYALLPVLKSFHLVDRLPAQLTVRLLLRVAWDVPAGLARNTTRAVLRVPGRFFQWLRSLGRAELQLAEVDDASEFRLGRFAVDLVDTGAVTSLRELAAAPDFHHFFQEADSRKYIKVVERRLLQIIRNFLKEHNVDLGDHNAREAIILDNSTKNYEAIHYGDGDINQGGRHYSRSAGR
jgi:hypothetical protein